MKTSMRIYTLAVSCACALVLGPAGCDAGVVEGMPGADGAGAGDAACTPSCSGRACGSDGCGGSCGACSGEGQVCAEASGQCIVCTPDCADRACGLELACGSACGTCAPGEVCNAAGQCDEQCVPECGEAKCGPDPLCGTLDCGACAAGTECGDDGQCRPACVPDCQGRACGLDPVCGRLDCGSCAGNEVCGADGTCGPPCAQDCDPFSVVLLPDTQYYTAKQAAGPKNTLSKQLQWVLDHRVDHNIRFVIHMGDITNNNVAAQWAAADAAYDLLDAAGMPYSVVPGNHDYRDATGLPVRGASLIDDPQYFPPSRCAANPWYGDALNGSSANNYTLFEAGQYKFLVISLEYGPRKEALCWAEKVIAAHPDRRVIIVSHCIQTHGGGFNLNCPKADFKMIGGSGQTIFDELAQRHSNVFLLLSGHVHDSEHRTLHGVAKNPIQAILTDYQSEGVKGCKAGAYAGNGWMRELVFTPLENRVYVKTFTVEEGNTTLFPSGKPTLYCDTASTDPASSDHQFHFDYDLSSPVAPDVRSEGTRAFSDFTVNSVAAGDQRAPVLAGQRLGGFVALWEDDSSKADGAGNFDVMMRGFAPGGCEAFSQRLASPSEAGQQLAPAAGVAADGTFVVAWQEGSGASSQIRARGFAADGTERIATFTVNGVASGSQQRPAVAVAADGRFTIAWEDDRDNNGKPQVWVRGFAADGAPRFAETSVHSNSDGVRQRPAIAPLPNGGFVVVWEDDGDGNGSYQIHARGFNADGSERVARLTVNSTAAGQQRNPAVGADDGGGFVVAWEDDQDNDSKFKILARGFASDGNQRFADQQAHAVAGGQHRHPSLVVAGNGAFALAWQDDGDDNGTYQIRAAGFSSAGAASLKERTINTIAAGQQLAPGAALDSSGALAVIWQDDLDGNGAYQLLARGVSWSLP